MTVSQRNVVCQILGDLARSWNYQVRAVMESDEQKNRGKQIFRPPRSGRIESQIFQQGDSLEVIAGVLTLPKLLIR